jgi:sporulation protein YlmC with PRC-barrel domain
MNNFEAANATGKNRDGARPNTPLKFLTASSIIGDKVLDPQGEKLGSIKDIMIDLRNGKVEYVVVELGGFLGIGEKYFAIPFSILQVDPKHEAFLINQSKETLKNAPGFNKEHWPETNSHEFERSGAYWGDFMGANTGAVPY